MSNRVETVDVVKSLVSLLEFTYIIDNIIDNGDGTYTLESCNTYHLHEFLIITIDALEYTIQSTVYNESITITGNPLPTATSFDIPAPFYFHGTVIKTNLELINLDQFDKMPMVYLLEVLEDDFLHRDEIIDRNSDLRLFFLTSANFTEWKTGDHYKNAIEPMRSLAYNFIDAVDSSKIIDTFAIKNFPVLSLLAPKGQQAIKDEPPPPKKSFASTFFKVPESLTRTSIPVAAVINALLLMAVDPTVNAPLPVTSPVWFAFVTLAVFSTTALLAETLASV